MSTRRERVVLELQDDFTGEMLRAAAATEVLNRELKKLSGSTGGRNQSITRMSRDAAAAERDVSKLGRSADKTKNQLDSMSGRVSLVGDALATLGPGLIPIGAVGVPAIAGLASQLGFAAAGAGVLIGSFQGVGDALKAVNKAALEPTTANLAAAKEAMHGISPAARGFVRELQSMEPELKRLRDVGATNMFPGFTEGLNSLERVFPRVQNIVGSIATELGNIGAESGASLASDRWAPFLEFIAREAPAALHDLAAIAGNTGHAMAELWMAFTPTNREFSSFLVSASQDLDRWASGLSKTAGFQEFINYVQTNGPQVGATLGALANAFLQIVEAAAPLGGPVLHIIESLANAVAGLANSDLGTPIMIGVAAWRAYAVAASVAEKAQKRLNATSSGGLGMAGLSSKASGTKAFAAQTKRDLGTVISTWNKGGVVTERESARMAESSNRLKGSLRNVGKGAAGVAALGVATTGLADGIGLTNTVTLALAGTMFGPWGTAIGAGAGAVIDLTHANDGLNKSLESLKANAGKVEFSAFNQQLDDTQKKIDDLKHVTGVGDWFGDAFSQLGNVVTGKGLDGGVAAAQKKKDAAEAVNDNAARTRGAALANAALAASSGLAARGFNLTAAGARNAGMSIAQFTASIQGANAVLTRQGTLDAYRTSLLDAADALKQNGKTLNGNTRAGLANRAMLRQLATGAIDYGTKMKDAAKRTEFMDKARNDFVRMAKAMGATGAEARSMANKFGLIDQGARGAGVEVKSLQQKINGLKSKIVDAKAKGAKESSAEVRGLRAEIAKLKAKQVAIKEEGAAAAAQRVHDLRAAIAQLSGKTVTVTTVHNDRYHKVAADGATILPLGGTVAGARMPYGDKVPTLLAPGEEVISNRYGQADRNRALLKKINANALADGGTVQRLAAGGSVARASGPGVTVTFPAPAVYAAAVKAADAIAAAAVKTTVTAQDLRGVHLDDLHLQQQIRDTQVSLNEHVKKNIKVKEKDKKGHVHKVTKSVTTKKFAVTGLDRTTAQAELADLKAQLAEQRKQNAVQKALADAKAEAVAAQQQARADTTAELTGGIDLFAGGASSAVRNVNRYVADISTAGQVMAQLRAKGASPLLLQQIQQHVLQGDVRAAVNLGQAFLAQPALLGQLNSSLSTLGSVSANVAALTTDPRFTQTGKWNPTGQATSTKVVQVQLEADPSTWMTTLVNRTTANVLQAMNGGR